jgi:hypothetical protein
VRRMSQPSIVYKVERAIGFSTFTMHFGYFIYLVHLVCFISRSQQLIYPVLSAVITAMAFVRDIQERNSASTPPAPPSLADPSTSGFPSVPHRSQRVSAFKRARTENAARQTYSSSTAQEAPTIGIATSGLAPAPPAAAGPLTTSSASTSAPNRQPSDIQGMLSEIQAENENKVAAMSDAERQRELQELQESFSPGIMEMLAQRAMRRAQQAQAAQATPLQEERRDVSQEDQSQPVAEVVDVASGSRTGESAPEEHTSSLNQALREYSVNSFRHMLIFS